MTAAQDPLAVLAAAAPTKTAVIEEDRRLSYAEFNALVNRYANLLIDLGVRAGSKVAWCGRNSAEEAAYVIENADTAIVLFDIEQARRLEPAAREVSGVRAWLAFRCGAGEVPGWAAHLDARATGSRETEPVPLGADSAAGTSMFYTSGTTARTSAASIWPPTRHLAGSTGSKRSRVTRPGRHSRAGSATRTGNLTARRSADRSGAA